MIQNHLHTNYKDISYVYFNIYHVWGEAWKHHCKTTRLLLILSLSLLLEYNCLPPKSSKNPLPNHLDFLSTQRDTIDVISQKSMILSIIIFAYKIHITDRYSEKVFSFF